MKERITLKLTVFGVLIVTSIWVCQVHHMDLKPHDYRELIPKVECEETEKMEIRDEIYCNDRDWR